MDPRLLEVGRNYGARGARLFARCILPAALPVDLHRPAARSRAGAGRDRRRGVHRGQVGPRPPRVPPLADAEHRRDVRGPSRWSGALGLLLTRGLRALQRAALAWQDDAGWSDRTRETPSARSSRPDHSCDVDELFARRPRARVRRAAVAAQARRAGGQDRLHPVRLLRGAVPPGRPLPHAGRDQRPDGPAARRRRDHQPGGDGPAPDGRLRHGRRRLQRRGGQAARRVRGAAAHGLPRGLLHGAQGGMGQRGQAHRRPQGAAGGAEHRGAAVEWMLDQVLRRDGLTIKDVQVKIMPFPDMVPALESGAVDAAILTEPFPRWPRRKAWRVRPLPRPAGAKAIPITATFWNARVGQGQRRPGQPGDARLRARRARSRRRRRHGWKRGPERGHHREVHRRQARGHQEGPRPRASTRTSSWTRACSTACSSFAPSSAT